MKILYGAFSSSTLVACASVKPVAINAGDRCLRCQAARSATSAWPAELIDRLRAPFPFRTAGCMAKYVEGRRRPSKSFAAIFVTDFQSGRPLIDATDAWFVPAKLAGPDGRRLRARLPGVPLPRRRGSGARGAAAAALGAGRRRSARISAAAMATLASARPSPARRQHAAARHPLSLARARADGLREVASS